MVSSVPHYTHHFIGFLNVIKTEPPSTYCNMKDAEAVFISKLSMGGYSGPENSSRTGETYKQQASRCCKEEGWTLLVLSFLLFLAVIQTHGPRLVGPMFTVYIYLYPVDPGYFSPTASCLRTKRLCLCSSGGTLYSSQRTIGKISRSFLVAFSRHYAKKAHKQSK